MCNMFFLLHLLVRQRYLQYFLNFIISHFNFLIHAQSQPYTHAHAHSHTCIHIHTHARTHKHHYHRRDWQDGRHKGSAGWGQESRWGDLHFDLVFHGVHPTQLIRYHSRTECVFERVTHFVVISSRLQRGSVLTGKIETNNSVLCIYTHSHTCMHT